MDDTKLLNRDNFKAFVKSNLAKINSSTCNHSEYKSWKNITSDKLKNEFIKTGDLNDAKFKGNYTYTQQIDKQYEYWSEDACIAVNLYPAQSAIVYQCPKCKNIFLQYIEDGGHGSQIRFRIVKPELVKDNLASFIFKVDEIEFKPFLNDLNLTLSDFQDRITECKELHGVPTTMKPNEVYIKDYTHFKHDEFPRTFEVVSNKTTILEMMKKYENRL